MSDTIVIKVVVPEASPAGFSPVLHHFPSFCLIVVVHMQQVVRMHSELAWVLTVFFSSFFWGGQLSVVALGELFGCYRVSVYLVHSFQCRCKV